MGVLVRMIKDHKFRDSRGKPVIKLVGEQYNIASQRILKNLVDYGVVERINCGNPTVIKIANSLASYDTRQRYGFFCNTSTFYSGGRVHLYQYAWSLAESGADVWFFTDRQPLWARDYPPQKNLRIVLGETTQPDDLDVLITDGKQSFGEKALRYRRAHGNAKLVLMNFETPNWVAQFNKKVANQMQHTMTVCNQADLLLCNSEESAKYLRKYIKVKVPVEVLNPAANNLALASVSKNPLKKEDRDTPFVVWSARGSAYKRMDVAMSSVKAYKGKLNLVCIGQAKDSYKKTDADHKMITFQKPITDAQKMWLMKNAKAVIAPSEFEGFGMVPAESLCAGTPVVVFDLPVLRQEYGDRLVYAKHGDAKDFAKKLHEVIDGAIDVAVDKAEAVERYGMKAMQNDVAKLMWHTPANKQRVTAQMICYYGPTVQEAIASVYDYVDEIKIAYGPTEKWKHVKPDNALALIKSFPDPDNKIELQVRKVWKNKDEMRNWCASRATGNRMLIFDADEIYSGLDEWLKADPMFACPKWVHFWHDLGHYVVDVPGDKRWGTPCKIGCYHNHYRWSFWKPSYSFYGGKGVRAQDIRKAVLSKPEETKRMANVCPNTIIYHLGHVLTPELMKAKHDFYLKRDGIDAGRLRRKEVWHNWDGKLGNQGDGCIKKVDWEIPALVQEAFDKLGAK